MTKVVESIKYGIEQNEWTKIRTQHVEVVLKVLKTAWVYGQVDDALIQRFMSHMGHSATSQENARNIRPRIVPIRFGRTS
jgi:hypothetical protein